MLLLLLMGLFFLRRSNDKDEPLYLQKVRGFVAEGRYQEAAEIQLKQGNKKEAFNLLERGKVHGEASYLAEELNLLDRAAFHAEHASDFKRAAGLYATLGQHERACQLYAREGLFANAARELEQTPTADLQRVAQLWEQALLQMFQKLGGPHQLAPPQLEEAKTYAQKSALFYEKAGNLPRAMQLFGISQDHEKVQQLQIQIQANPVAATLMGQPSEPLDPSFYPLTGIGGLGGTPPTGNLYNTPHPTGMGGMGGLGADALSSISKMVNQAVHQAMQNQPMQSSAHLPQVNVTMDGSQLQDVLQNTKAPVNVNVIQVPDAMSNGTTMIERDTDRYSIGDKIGEGGMAVVYKAFDQLLERDVALKFLPEGVTQTPLALTYFQREAKAAAALNHPNIVTIYDYGVLSGRPFICMELLQGATLEDLLERTDGRGMPLLSMFEIVEGLLTALDFAHSHQFVHRDIKPANVMYTTHHNIKLMDFGIARQGNASQQTVVAGTPQYMAPEQMLGRGIDHRTDLFAVGITLYELWTGLPPYEGMARTAPPPPPSNIRPIPEQLERLIMWCLQLQQDKRPPSAFDLLRQFRVVRSQLEHDPQYAEELVMDPSVLEARKNATPHPNMGIEEAPRLTTPVHGTELVAPTAMGAPPNPELSDIIDDLDDFGSRSNDSLDQLLAVYLDTNEQK